MSRIRLALVYFDIVSKQETLLTEIHDAEALKRYFEDQCERFLYWAEQELAHRTARNRALALCVFPIPPFARASGNWLRLFTGQLATNAVSLHKLPPA